MRNENRHISDTLLAKFLLGETSQEEQQIIIGWLEENIAHRKRLDQLEEVWLETGKLNPRPIPVNKHMAWKVLNKRLDHHEKLSSAVLTKFSKFKLVLYSAVAASVLILLGLFNWYLIDSSQKQEFLLTNNTKTTLTDTLPDGSKVHLNQLAQISYKPSADGHKRIVQLKGEAFFKVKRNTLKPFIIHAGIGSVKVLGTSFNVKIKKNRDIDVSVKTGRVELFYPNKALTDTLHMVLRAGESGLISLQKDSIIKITNPSAFFWMDKKLVFRNKPLKDVFEVLEDCYAVKINSNNPFINNLNYTSTFINKDINEVIKVVATSFNFTYTKEGITYTILELKKDE